MVSGNYMIRWSCLMYNTTTSKTVEMRIQVDSSTTLTESEVKPETAYEPMSGFKVYNFTNGNHYIDMDFREVDGGTAKIKEARIWVTKTDNIQITQFYENSE